jgi:biotin carboxyl carrier protein
MSAARPRFEFVQQLAPAGSLIGTGQAVCTLTDGTMEFHVNAPRQGLLVEWLAEHGAEIETDDVLARIVCEGESADVPAVEPARLG